MSRTKLALPTRSTVARPAVAERIRTSTSRPTSRSMSVGSIIRPKKSLVVKNTSLRCSSST